MHEGPTALSHLALSILERFAMLWRRWAFFILVKPLLDHHQSGAKLTKAQVHAMVRHLMRSEAHLARAIYRTARRLSGLPRIACPIEAFFRHPIREARDYPARFAYHLHAILHAKRYAIRLAHSWARQAERLAKDNLADLRDSDSIIDTCAPLPFPARANGSNTTRCASLPIRAPP